MVREVRTLWFREKSLLDDPLVTLPLVGDVSPRKLIYAVTFAIPGFVAAAALGFNPLIAALASGIAGLALAREPKAISVEKQLLYALTGSYRPSAAKPRRERELRRAKPEEIAKLILEELEPVKIHGLVVDPYTGSPVAGAELALCVDGKPVARTVSDSQGRYSFYAYLEPGSHVVEVRLGDQVIMRKAVVVSVRRR